MIKLMIILNFLAPIGAANGTWCGSGKACLAGNCVNNPQVPSDDCVYGDDLVSSSDLGNLVANNFNSTNALTTCSNALQFLLSAGYDPAW
jgi:hypothetical protein